MKIKAYALIIWSLLLTASLSAQTLEKISLQLLWKHQFEFAGFYMAQEKGFYKNAGLDVNFLEYENGVDVVKNIANGKTEYGIAYQDALLDKPSSKNIVLLAAIYQSSPHVLITLKSSNIKTLQDFKNKKIMMSLAAKNSASFMAMLRSNGVSLKEMIVVKPTYNVESLIEGKTDIITSYISNEPYILDKKGIAYDIWDPRDYGFDVYNDLLITSKQELKNHPKRVENFRKASLKGWEYAFSHIDETINVILQKYNTQHKTKDELYFEAQKLKKLAYENNTKIGTVDKYKIQRIIDIYNVLGLTKGKINLDTFIYKQPLHYALTEQDKEYLNKKKTITMCVDPDWMPFEKLSNGKHIGMSAEYFEHFKKFLNIPVKVISTKSWEQSLEYAKSRKCDILSLLMKTPQRTKYLNFTDPYLKIPIVMATKTDAPFTTDFTSLKNKKIGLPKGYAFIEILKTKYPNLKIVEVKNLQDGLNQVREGKIYGYIGSLATIGYAFSKQYTGELKIAGKFDGTWDLGIGVRNDDNRLLHIMQKAVHSVDEASREKILNNWLAIKYEKGIDYSLVWKIILLFSAVFFIILIFYFKMTKLKNKIQKQNDEISTNHALLITLFNTIPNPVFYKDKNGVYQNCNHAFSQKIIGVPKEKIIGRSLQDLEEYIPPSLALIYQQKDEELLKSRGTQKYEAQVQCADGMLRDYILNKAVILSDTNEVLGIVGIMLDITEVKEKEKELLTLATVDFLTKLYNRRYCMQTGEKLFMLAKRHKQLMSVIMIDIDDFKNINDTYGHKMGDNVLESLALTISKNIRQSDVACRFGGEEFLILLPQTDKENTFNIAQKIRQEIKKTADVNALHITASFGVSQLDIEKDNNLEELIKRADEALYIAKNKGKDKVVTV
ncbi:ABC transporter substrate-binding protein [Sulfurimonas paralvinellae]|uniref:diguanylate cyclase n=1 Tax=Sulfurimonas paralvinellae TaxID=317658 RepID=A0A7M1B9A6_9BACT|nr:ABC transporter substrate-binding protein [Sulfurimonas paralvinellae]QOP46265.1 diguanylate cyclase [Sulfurimonas paralvinellae]